MLASSHSLFGPVNFVRSNKLNFPIVSDSQMFTASEDTTMRVWSAETGQVCELKEQSF